MASWTVMQIYLSKDILAPSLDAYMRTADQHKPAPIPKKS